MKRSLFLAVLTVMVLSLCACASTKEVADMEYTATINDCQYDGVYTGTVIKKIPNGNGNFTFTDAQITLDYSGQWENGLPVGTATMKYAGYEFSYDDNTYVGSYSGEAVNGIPNGEGNFTFEDAQITLDYSGQWKDGVPNGNGSLNLTEETYYLEYVGSWVNGAMSGEGELKSDAYVVHFLDGIVRTGEYKGQVLNGIASGEGSFIAVNDEGNRYTYTGGWKDGLFNGYGEHRFDDPSIKIKKGNFTDGDFDPTPLQYFTTQGTAGDSPYSITENAIKTLEAYPDIFLNNSIENVDIEFEENFKYNAYSKNPDRYGEKLISVSGLKVIQIFEETYWGADHTFCLAEDSNGNVYYTFMYGFADDIYENSRITLTALPLDYFTYVSVANQKIWAIACAAVSIK